ncbi:MAG: hypothetical protein ACHQK9_04430 [Reyranellales bacterium]
MLRAITTLALILGLAAFGAPSAFAQKGSSHGGGTPGGMTIDRDHDGDRDRNQAQRPATNRNSNGINAIDRDKGHDRAEDRMNDHGLDNNKAGIRDRDDVRR